MNQYNALRRTFSLCYFRYFNWDKAVDRMRAAWSRLTAQQQAEVMNYAKGKDAWWMQVIDQQMHGTVSPSTACGFVMSEMVNMIEHAKAREEEMLQAAG